MLKNKLKEDIYKYRNLNEEAVKGDKWRNRYHLMAPIGWINDPNGLCYFNGEYHVYYQYAPLHCDGGLKFWGHYSSRDFVTWQEEDIALYPDTKYDRDGVYSGSALVKDNKVYFFYTGNVKETGDYDYILKGREQNVIMVESEDGINFSEKTLLLENKDFPGNMSLHVRDPKVWEEDGLYYMVLGARGKDNKGYILIYTSSDLYHWKIKGSPIGGSDGMGYMWECPDLFKLDNQQVFLFSPQGVKAEGYKYNNIYQSGYIIGSLDKEINLDRFYELDRGFDFYAPQTFVDNMGHRILIGWMGVPDAVEHINPTVDNNWQHQLTIPRELKIKNNRLIQQPIKELENLRKDPFMINDIDIEVKKSFNIFDSNSYEIILDLAQCEKIEISLREDCKLKFNKGIFQLELGKSGYGRDKRGVELKELTKIQIYSDNSSLEIFLNDGEEVFSTRIYNDSVDKIINIKGNGKVSLKKWSLM